MIEQKTSHLIFFNNQLIQSDYTLYQANDRGINLGDGVFETILSYNNKLPFFQYHWQRLHNALDLLKINLSDNYSKEYIHSVIIDLLAKNQSQSKARGIKIIITRGGGPRSVEPLVNYAYTPNVLINSFDVDCNTLESLNTKKLTLSAIKVNQSSPLSNIKSLNYLDRVIAKQQALDNKYDDAVLINFENNICSATTSNIFFILQDNTVITPPLSDGVLPGITRDFVINTLANKKYSVRQCSINIEQLITMSNLKAAFITNAIQGITEISQIGSNYFESHQITEYINDMFIKAIRGLG